MQYVVLWFFFSVLCSRRDGDPNIPTYLYSTCRYLGMQRKKAAWHELIHRIQISSTKLRENVMEKTSTYSSWCDIFPILVYLGTYV